MIVVCVVNRKFPQASAFEFPAAMAAYPGKKLQRLFPVSVLPRLLGLQGHLKACFFI
jgi:hypothetical protein